ncbi:hypothetical protein LIER_37775 [Lithospermum erythrorhizon]|uniref:Uncharacterized protein n=1 Tax=Lithospermum erythrorhizon TaxID=34254 RepID=A0AAV3PQH2_LITER
MAGPFGRGKNSSIRLRKYTRNITKKRKVAAETKGGKLYVRKLLSSTKKKSSKAGTRKAEEQGSESGSSNHSSPKPTK